VNIKKLTAAVLTAAMAAAAFTGCSKSFEKVVTVDGVDIAPGNYLFAQYQAYLEAEALVADSTVDLMDTLIEDTASKEWMHSETIDNLKLYVWTDKTFEEMGLELSQEEMDYINSQSEYYWPYNEEAYVVNGIGEETYKTSVVNSYKLEKIFAAIYGAGGEKEPTDAEYKEYMDTQYARIKGFELPKINDLQAFPSAEQLSQIVFWCEEAVAALNSGADFEETQVKYMTLVGELLGKAADYSETPSQYTQQRFLQKTNVEPGEELFVANAFVAEVDGPFTYEETTDSFVIYQRVANTTSDEELEYYKSSLLTTMKSEEFAEYAEAQAASLEVSEDAAAVKFYALEKIK